MIRCFQRLQATFAAYAVTGAVNSELKRNFTSHFSCMWKTSAALQSFIKRPFMFMYVMSGTSNIAMIYYKKFSAIHKVSSSNSQTNIKT